MNKQNELGLNIQQGIKSVEEFRFEPIKSYPMLHWKGKRPFTGTQFYPAQLKERHGEEVNGWINKIFWGDNLQVMSHLLKEFRGKIDLVYIDPPYDSKADYKLKVEKKGKVATSNITSFEEKQYTDLWSNDEYLQFLYERIVLIRELISDQGIILLHCDWHKSHHIRCILDEIFGKENFVNEIIWQKIRVAKAQSKTFGNVHDNIFIYSKGELNYFRKSFSEPDEAYKSKFYKIEEGTGRRYQPVSLLQAGQGEPRYFGEQLLYPGVDKHWIWSQDRINEALKNNLIEFSETGIPRKKQYLDESSGREITDIWTDIYPLNSQATEDTGYPTQKPESLIARIIHSFTHDRALIFDCFMGSGTTQAVALKLGRRFIGADINLGAIQTTTKRLLNLVAELKDDNPKEPKLLQLKMEEEQSDEEELLMAAEDQASYGKEEKPDVLYTSFEVYNVNHYDVFRNPIEAKELLIKALEIQPLPNNNLYDGEKDGRMVKIMPVNRIATRVDLNEMATNFDYKVFEKRAQESPGKPVESILLVCMGHEPDLAASLIKNTPFKLDVEVVDILRDKSNLEFKRESEASIRVDKSRLTIEQFYPMNLLQKLSLMKENVNDWRELVESVMIDFNYDGSVFEPKLVDIPDQNELVKGEYEIPKDAGTIHLKITDLLSESFEQTINGKA